MTSEEYRKRLAEINRSIDNTLEDLERGRKDVEDTRRAIEGGYGIEYLRRELGL